MPTTMQAVVQRAYGLPHDVLNWEERRRPVPGDGEVLVRVRAAGVNIGDWHLLRGVPFVVRLMFGLRRPRAPVPGMNLAGTVAAAGGGVAGLQAGDAVFGYAKGAFAEYVCAPAEQFARKPERLSWEQAAALGDSAVTALVALRDQAAVQPGRRVLIVGASGGVGSFAVQMAKAFGAHTTAVCRGAKADFVRDLGADDVIDYTQENFWETGKTFDAVIDVYGSPSLGHCRKVLAPEGTYVLVGGAIKGWWIRNLKVALGNLFTRQKLTMFIAEANPADLETLRAMAEAGTVTPALDRTFPLAETASALAHVGEAHARGKTVVVAEPT